ncbi:MAG: hypothetical protein GX410_09130 [Elusimicrobia bacterium]|nr:hypothetical protein [Elusimicrobiota bacterium]
MRAFVLCLAAALACACASGRPAALNHAPGTPQQEPDLAKREIPLSPSATQQDFADFQKTVERTYIASLAGEDEPGFSYSVSPAGVANPFSRVEVACIMPQEHAAKSLPHCKKFLGMIAP